MSSKAADHSAPTFARLSGRKLAVARTVCVTLGLLTLVLFVAGLPTQYNEFRTLSIFGDVGIDRSEVRANLDQIGLSTAFYAGYYVAVGVTLAIACFAAATIIFLRRSTEAIALLTVVALVTPGGELVGGRRHSGDAPPTLGMVEQFP